MYAEVSDVTKLTPNLLRVALTGGTLDEFEPSAATDSYVVARFLPKDSPVTVPFVSDDLDGVPAELRPKPRRYTVRRWEPDKQRLSIDFVAHGDDGYAGSWAQRAQPGDRLQFDGPRGSYQPAPDVDWHLLVGDESALPAIGATLEVLPPGAHALVFAVVDGPDHELELPSQATVTVDWSHRYGALDPESLLVDAVSAATFPAGSFDVFVHGEAAEVRAVRRHLVAERDVNPDTASISAYWRRNYTDEDWRKVKRQWMAEQAADA